MIVLVFFQSAMVAFFVGPVVAGLSGMLSGVSLRSWREAIISGRIGAFVGFYIMVVVTIVIMSLALPETGGGRGGSRSQMDVGQVFSPMLKAGLPTGIVGMLCGYVGTRF